MIPEKEREALMRLTMCARIECDICKYKESSIDECEERITQNMNILADALRADRKTEPQTCQECEHWNDTEDGCADRHGCKTEPQQVTSKLASVENSTVSVCESTMGQPKGKLEDEPQTDCAWK